MIREIKVKSPGRVNIIGEHTDYNDGYVLPAAIDKTIQVYLKMNGTESVVNVHALDVEEKCSLSLQGLEKSKTGWQNYVIGVIAELQKINSNFTGFDLEFGGDVPMGSGMSSSAALECSLAYAINELFDLKIDKPALIKACQMAEHNYVGTRCGIMDQFASVMGKKDHVILLDCKSMEYGYFPIELGAYEILLLNTNMSHNLAESEYNQRRADCENAMQLIKKNNPVVNSFRDISLDQLNSLKEKLGDQWYRRCHHVVTENARVLSATEALWNKNIEELGKLMYQSHQSLSKDYEVSCEHLDYLVEQTNELDFILGSRMMGGGFGGCTISLIHKEHTTAFIKTITEAYKAQFDITLLPYQVSIEDGTSVVK